MVFGTKDTAQQSQAIHRTEGQSLRLVASLDVKLMTKDQISASNETSDRNNETSTDQTML
jgi:hypothetical protein